jgi:hypothetical protein
LVHNDDENLMDDRQECMSAGVAMKDMLHADDA